MNDGRLARRLPADRAIAGGVSRRPSCPLLGGVVSHHIPGAAGAVSQPRLQHGLRDRTAPTAAHPMVVAYPCARLHDPMVLTTTGLAPQITFAATFLFCEGNPQSSAKPLHVALRNQLGQVQRFREGVVPLEQHLGARVRVEVVANLWRCAMLGKIGQLFKGRRRY